MSICSSTWESHQDLKQRTGLKLADLNRILRDEMADKICECHLEGDETLLIPFFRLKSNQPQG